MLTQTPFSTSSVPPLEKRKEKPNKNDRRWRSIVAVLLALATVITMGYAAFGISIATRVAPMARMPLAGTPASFGLQYKDVTFPSRGDGLQLKGWLIPGVLLDGHLTTERTIILIHGNTTNRADPNAWLLRLTSDLAHRGFAVLAFDLRGAGESPDAPRSLGILEQRDILGAVDFLRSGPLSYSELGRPHAIAGYGLSLGGASLILAAAQEPAIQAIVSDCAFADPVPILEREIPKGGNFPAMFTPGGLVAYQALYGVDFYSTRPSAAIASIAPRPILLIHGAIDAYTPSSNMDTLATSARSAPNAHVQTWMVPGANHAESYKIEGKAYVDRIVAFYTASLGPDTSGL